MADSSRKVGELREPDDAVYLVMDGLLYRCVPVVRAARC